jgi:hypothetical protein
MMRRAAGFIALLAVAPIGATGYALWKRYHLRMRLSGELDQVTYQTYEAFATSDFGRLYLSCASSLQASVTAAEFRAAFEAFVREHGPCVDMGALSIDTRGTDLARPTVGPAESYQYSIAFEKAGTVPLELDLIWDGDVLRPTRIALRAPRAPLELPPPKR